MADDVTFYFDPICPFTWRTSRWLRDVTEPREHTVAWRLMSLNILNDGQQLSEQHRAAMETSTRAIRLLLAAGQQHGNAAVANLYTEVGRRMHDEGATFDDDLFAASLDAAGLPRSLASAADDTGLDDAIQESHDEGQARVGEESGSPILCIGDGPGYFGPVVSAVPDGEAAEKLYDAVRLLSAVPEFSELKRSRGGA